MQSTRNGTLTRHLLSLIVFIICCMIGLMTVRAQGGATVTISGTLQAINSDGTIVVDGVTYNLGEGVTLPVSAQVGTIVVLSGQFTSSSVLIIISVSVDISVVNPSLTATPVATGSVPPTPTVSATPVPNDGEVIVVVEGPVRVININIIIIYNISVIIAPDDPLLKVIHIGDFVRAKGHFDGQGMLIASLITNVLDPSSIATVSLDGNVQAINGNIIVINDIVVHIDPRNVILTKIKVGDVIHVDGNFQRNGTTLIVIVINITIVNNVTIINPGLPPGCKMSKNGHIKCSKKSKKSK